MERHRRQIALAYDAEVRGRDGYGATRLAVETGRSPQTGVKAVHNWGAGISAPNLAEYLRHVELLLAEDPERARRFVQRVHEHLGIQAVVLPGARPGAGIATDTMEVSAAAGELAHEVAQAQRDGQVDHVEAARIRRAAGRVLVEGLEVVADADEVPSPQLVMGGMP